ncbi:MAG: FliI/YscN family ATPase [Spirochaetales bacterium]|nr:FliI/YscN family ATPase [Spirochaetales bacterium]
MWFEKYNTVLDRTDPIKLTGVVTRVLGLLVESQGPQVKIGEVCQILVPYSPPGDGIPEGREGEAEFFSVRGKPHSLKIERSTISVPAEVVGFHDKTVQLMPYGNMDGIEPGSMVVAMGEPLSIPVSEGLLGRVLDSTGHPMDGRGSVSPEAWYPVQNKPPDVLTRKNIDRRIHTGVRSIDSLIPVGRGQRLGIFSGSGVGKSTLLGMIARNTNADVNVIALIGERGREVREFIENDLGEEGLKRSVIIVSSSDTPPLSRLRGAYAATAVAEYFRDQGRDVMLLFDSVTRFARAQREIGLAMGEPPANRGFPPSVFEKLPQLLERCGTSQKGTITGFYTILVEGDDMDEPIADNVRGILDGHIILDRKLAQSYHYPAINVLNSLSRLETKITTMQTRKAMGHIRRLLAAYADAEDLINVGAYAEGSNPVIDEAISKHVVLNEFLQQDIEEKAPLSDTLEQVSLITGLPMDELEKINA